PNQSDRVGRPNFQAPHRIEEIIQVADCLTVDGGDGIALEDSRLCRRAAGLDRDDQQAGRLTKLTFEPLTEADRLSADAKIRAADATMALEALDHLLDRAAGQRSADPSTKV